MKVESQVTERHYDLTEIPESTLRIIVSMVRHSAGTSKFWQPGAVKIAEEFIDKINNHRMAFGSAPI